MVRSNAASPHVPFVPITFRKAHRGRKCRAAPYVLPRSASGGDEVLWPAAPRARVNILLKHRRVGARKERRRHAGVAWRAPVVRRRHVEVALDAEPLDEHVARPAVEVGLPGDRARNDATTELL